VERQPPGRRLHVSSRHHHQFSAPSRRWARAGLLAGAAALVSTALPSGVGDAAPAAPAAGGQSVIARARALSNEINTLSEQADGLKIQLKQARSEAGLAELTYQRDLKRLAAGQRLVGELASQSYMNGGLASAMELITTSTPAELINRAAIVAEVQSETGDRVGQILAAVTAARRAQESAQQQSQRAAALSAQIASKRRAAQAKIATLNSSVFKTAMRQFSKTGQYPNLAIPTENTIGAQALRYALSQRGKPYEWGAAGPNAYDCSGLVMWAYGKVGISLPHFTGDQWNMGVHVSRQDLEPGDLVFFFADIGHVGLYIGDGLMVDAPDFGQDVQVQPVMWDVYVGAVRIVG